MDEKGVTPIQMALNRRSALLGSDIASAQAFLKSAKNNLIDSVAYADESQMNIIASLIESIESIDKQLGNTFGKAVQDHLRANETNSYAW